MKTLAAIAASPVYWLALLVLGLSLEGVALYFQYRLDYGPCVLCIHVRIWVLGLIAVSLSGLLLRHTRAGRVLSQLLLIVIAAGLLERSWKLFAIERGMDLGGECNFDAGLPAWFALDQWFPALFQVWEACGYTPELAFGVTMAEALLVMSVLLLLSGMTLLLASLVSDSAG
jgi:disulfide bond formation protein DsbB